MPNDKKYLKAIVIHLDHFCESKVSHEKNFSIDELNDANKWLSNYDSGDNICQCYEMSL